MILFMGDSLAHRPAVTAEGTSAIPKREEEGEKCLQRRECAILNFKKPFAIKAWFFKGFFSFPFLSGGFRGTPERGEISAEIPPSPPKS